MRQHPEHLIPARDQIDHGLVALLGHRDGCGRVPVRPGNRARPQPRRIRPGRAAADRHPRRPAAVRCEAHRRAMGRRLGRLPGRRLPRAMGGMERPLPRHRPCGLDPARVRCGRAGLPDHRIERPVPALGPAAVGFGQLRDRTRRLHPGRSRLPRRETQRGQRRGEPRRRRLQPLDELRRGGPDR